MIGVMKMSDIKNGDMPVSPCTIQPNPDAVAQSLGMNRPLPLPFTHKGLTKREAFAMAAMQGFITAGHNGMPKAADLAVLSTSYADALLKELAK